VSLNPAHGEVHSIQHYVIKVCQWLTRIPTGIYWVMYWLLLYFQKLWMCYEYIFSFCKISFEVIIDYCIYCILHQSNLQDLYQFKLCVSLNLYIYICIHFVFNLLSSSLKRSTLTKWQQYHPLCFPQTLVTFADFSYTVQLFGFLLFWLGAYLIKLIPETCHAHTKFDVYIFITSFLFFFFFCS
jgi:hypothetical protein